MDLRKEINLNLADGNKISVNDFIIKATALALSLPQFECLHLGK